MDDTKIEYNNRRKGEKKSEKKKIVHLKLSC